MATTIASKILINISLLLLIGVNLASSREYSGVLARLYKKASKQDRPLILVLDNGHREKSNNVHKTHKHSVANSKISKDLAPLVYLYQLGQAQKKKQLVQRSQRLRDDRDDYKWQSRNRHQDISERLQFSDEKDRREIRDRREEREGREERDRREKRDRYRFKDSATSEDNDNDVISSPLLKQLLDITNNLLRQNDDRCDESNECGVSKEQEIVEAETTTDTQISTKGVLYESETYDGCKKCH